MLTHVPELGQGLVSIVAYQQKVEEQMGKRCSAFTESNHRIIITATKDLIVQNHIDIYVSL